MQTKALIQIAKAAEMKERAARRFGSLCSKYKVSEFDKPLFVAAMLYYRMNIYESLCDKYKMAEYDRNNFISTLVIALTARNSNLTGRLILK